METILTRVPRVAMYSTCVSEVCESSDLLYFTVTIVMLAALNYIIKLHLSTVYCDLLVIYNLRILNNEQISLCSRDSNTIVFSCARKYGPIWYCHSVYIGQYLNAP